MKEKNNKKKRKKNKNKNNKTKTKEKMMMQMTMVLFTQSSLIGINAVLPEGPVIVFYPGFIAQLPSEFDKTSSINFNELIPTRQLVCFSWVKNSNRKIMSCHIYDLAGI